jgi:hypothetical protein
MPFVKKAQVAPKAAPKVDIVAEQMARMKSKMKARPNWETNDFGLELGGDRLNISREKVEALARDGVALQWATASVRGQEQRGAMRQTTAAGWTPVHASDFDGIFNDGFFVPKDADEVIQVDDCLLVARPMGLHEKAKKEDRALANERLEAPMRTVREGINATGGRHVSVRNQINVYEDRVEIPD